MASIILFENRQGRLVWNDYIEKWHFPVVDVVLILTDSPDPKDYWYSMKKREKHSGVELSTICRQRISLAQGFSPGI